MVLNKPAQILRRRWLGQFPVIVSNPGFLKFLLPESPLFLRKEGQIRPGPGVLPIVEQEGKEVGQDFSGLVILPHQLFENLLGPAFLPLLQVRIGQAQPGLIRGGGIRRGRCPGKEGNGLGIISPPEKSPPLGKLVLQRGRSGWGQAHRRLLSGFSHLLEFRFQKPGFVGVLGNLGLVLFLVQVLKLGLPPLLGPDVPQAGDEESDGDEGKNLLHSNLSGLATQNYVDQVGPWCQEPRPRPLRLPK